MSNRAERKALRSYLAAKSELWEGRAWTYASAHDNRAFKRQARRASRRLATIIIRSEMAQ